MSNKSTSAVATMGIDIRKNSFHVIGLDPRGAIVLRQKWSRSQIEEPRPARFPSNQWVTTATYRTSHGNRAVP